MRGADLTTRMKKRWITPTNPEGYAGQTCGRSHGTSINWQGSK